jgi:hypothetical protein
MGYPFGTRERDWRIAWINLMTDASGEHGKSERRMARNGRVGRRLALHESSECSAERAEDENRLAIEACA